MSIGLRKWSVTTHNRIYFQDNEYFPDELAYNEPNIFQIQYEYLPKEMVYNDS